MGNTLYMVYLLHGIPYTWVIRYTWYTLYMVYLIHGLYLIHGIPYTWYTLYMVIPEILVILIMKMLVILVYINNYRIF